MDEQTLEHRVPLVEEQVRIDKRKVETGVVRIRTGVDERIEWITEELLREEVQLERVAIGREVPEPPPMRQEGDVLIIPVVEEKLVVSRQWVLVEELHVRKDRRTESHQVPVALKTSTVSVERDPPAEGSSES